MLSTVASILAIFFVSLYMTRYNAPHTKKHMQLPCWYNISNEEEEKAKVRKKSQLSGWLVTLKTMHFSSNLTFPSFIYTQLSLLSHFIAKNNTVCKDSIGLSVAVRIALDSKSKTYTFFMCTVTRCPYQNTR